MAFAAPDYDKYPLTGSASQEPAAQQYFANLELQKAKVEQALAASGGDLSALPPQLLALVTSQGEGEELTLAEKQQANADAADVGFALPYPEAGLPAGYGAPAPEPAPKPGPAVGPYKAEWEEAHQMGAVTYFDYLTAYNMGFTYPVPLKTAGKQKGATTMPTWPTGAWEAAAPQFAWNQAFGLPAFGFNPFQAMMAQQAAPAYAGWLGGQILPGATPQAFAPGAYTSPGLAGAQSLAALQAARALPSAEQVEWQQGMASPESNIASMAALLQGALGAGGAGFAAPVANILAGRLPRMQAGWTAQTQGGATGPTFLEYLMSKYGL